MNTKTPSITASSSFVDIMEKNHMEIPWHDYTNNDSDHAFLWHRCLACPFLYE